MNSRKIISLLMIVIAGVVLFKTLGDDEHLHNPKIFGPPEKTQWKPMGRRVAGQHDYDIIPEPDTFRIAVNLRTTLADQV